MSKIKQSIIELNHNKPLKEYNLFLTEFPELSFTFFFDSAKIFVDLEGPENSIQTFIRDIGQDAVFYEII